MRVREHLIHAPTSDGGVGGDFRSLRSLLKGCRGVCAHAPTSDGGVGGDFPSLRSLLKGCRGVCAHMHVPSIPT
jgi:hypothetical protein